MHNYGNIIRPLLNALGWKGEERDLQQALPRFTTLGDVMTMASLRDTLVNLGYASTLVGNLKNRNLPALGIDASGGLHIILGHDTVPAVAGGFKEFLVFSAVAPALGLQGQGTTLWQELRRFQPQLKEIFFISLIIGIIGLAPIFYNRSLYDHIIGSGSATGLPVLFFGVMAALAAETLLRIIRNRRISAFGGRMDHVVSCSVFERLLFLPPLYTERTAVSSQIARLRDFENVREFFTGPLAILFFEFPLILIYVVIMGALAGWLVLIPIALIGAYALLLSSMNSRLKETSRASATAVSQSQEFLLETITKLPALRLAGMEHVWQTRYRNLSAQASYASFRASYTAQILETYSYVLMTLSGIITLGFGVNQVIEQTLSVGALIAAMMIVWRIMAPLQICCASITRLQQLKSSTQQVRKLLSFAPEHNPQSLTVQRPQLQGRITFNRVSLRYAAESEPAMLGVTFDAQPGQIIAIRGHNGSGKSSILKVVLGLYRPQNGTVRIDGIDIRQFDPVLLRQSMAYVPQNADLFPGTIRDNLLYADPGVSEGEYLQALRESCAYDEIMELPRQLDTPVEGDDVEPVSFMLKQRINLARAYLRKAPIMLFDEASHSLGLDNDIAFANKIESLRGQSTVLLVTHREDHMQLADILLVMDKGELTHAGPPEQVLNVLRGKR